MATHTDESHERYYEEEDAEGDEGAVQQAYAVGAGLFAQPYAGDKDGDGKE